MVISDAAAAYRDALAEKERRDGRAWSDALAVSERALAEVQGQ